MVQCIHTSGVEVLKATVAQVKSEAALRVALPLLAAPVAERTNWTIPRLRSEIELRECVKISRAQLSKTLRKKVSPEMTATHAEGSSGCG